MDNSTILSRAESPEQPGHENPVISFIIGLSIIFLASVLNAAGLNLTKLDHVRTSVIPKVARKKDWMRPLWLLGMLLYVLSQLIGSTLALEYMRAEYVAPLGSSSLVFNFLFARFLVGTPVTSNDIYGTVVVVLGVVGIVAFGSINSGLATEMDVERLTYLWQRGGWIGYFICMSGALVGVLIFASTLDVILTARADISLPTTNESSANEIGRREPFSRNLDSSAVVNTFRAVARMSSSVMHWIHSRLELWTAQKDDKQVAWTLGIGWACAGGGLAGGCLVFAKAIVKLLSGSIAHEKQGNQFAHASSVFTSIFLAVTAVLQILCLNRGLRVYDSTLVVPVFYGVYTATGFLNSLIFNDEVDAYQSWSLFLIFVSILVLISGVVLLTHKKPEPSLQTKLTPMARIRKVDDKRVGGEDSELDGHESTSEQQVLWAVGEEGDDDDDDDEGNDEDIDHHQHPLGNDVDRRGGNRRHDGLGEEVESLIQNDRGRPGDLR